MAPPKLDGAYFAIPDFAMSHAIKRSIMFIFLPLKEKPKDVIGNFLGTWCIICLKESGWGPPSSVLMMVAHLQKSLFYFSVSFYFLFRKSGSESCCFYFPIFVLLESQVRRVGYTIINSRGCAPL